MRNKRNFFTRREGPAQFHFRGHRNVLYGAGFFFAIVSTGINPWAHTGADEPAEHPNSPIAQAKRALANSVDLILLSNVSFRRAVD